MERQQEQWTDDILNSLDGLQPATANPQLFKGIMHRLQKGGQLRQLVPLRVVLAAAASFALLLTLNWQVMQKRTAATDQQTELMADQYGMAHNPLTLYQD